MNNTYKVTPSNIGDAIYCGNRLILLSFNNPQLIANVLNKEAAPLIEALEEKALENAKLRDEIESLRGLIQEIASADFTATDLRVMGAAQWRKKAQKIVDSWKDSE